MMADLELPDSLRDDLRAAWHRYVDFVAPIRPALHAYCRRLTGNLWDAEDLIQDTLLRAFGKLGCIHSSVQNPRAYLLRTATNLWIDGLRARRREDAAFAELERESEASDAPPLPGAARDAGRRLLQRLAPRERAAVLLKDVFDLDLQESAEIMETTVGAVKAALHRGRERMRESDDEPPVRRPVPSVALVDRFVELLNAGDKPGLLALVLDNATAENLGVGTEWGHDGHRGVRSMVNGIVHGHPEWPVEWQPEASRATRGLFHGEPLVLLLTTRRGREKLEAVFRLEEEDGCVSRLRSYAFCPETMREIGRELDVPVRTGPYRSPTPAPGQYYPLNAARS
jgi:RNA polymerase sigma-70 factor (ECF subfamily)